MALGKRQIKPLKEKLIFSHHNGKVISLCLTVRMPWATTQMQVQTHKQSQAVQINIILGGEEKPPFDTSLEMPHS